MLFALLVPQAILAVDCDLGIVDPGNQCDLYKVETTTDGNYNRWFGSLDADGVDPASKQVFLHIFKTTENYTDHNNRKHPPTKGNLNYDGSRWVLDCEQESTSEDDCDGACPEANDPHDQYFDGNYKTLRLQVTRPESLPRGILTFQAEFLQMYEKGSWEKIRSEHEPYTHNDYGSVVPLDQFRNSGGTATDGTRLENNDNVTSAYFNVFMAAPERGDFEFRYGNPNLVYGRTRSDEFCSTMITSGNQDPIAPTDSSSYSDCGTWTALEFSENTLRVGTPWKECGTGTTLANIQNQQKVGAILPAYLGHPNLKETEYTTFTTAARSTEVETFVVLDIFSPEAGNTNGIGDDGVVYENNVQKWTYSSTGDAQYQGQESVATTGYTKCYEAGTPCAQNHNVCKASHCNIDRWGAIQNELRNENGLNNGGSIKTLGYIETMVDGVTRAQSDIEKDIAAYKFFAATNVNGYFFANVDTSQKAHTDKVMNISASIPANDCVGDTKCTIVFGTGQALTDRSVVDDSSTVDIVVTLSADKANKRDWNPFAWYPKKAPQQWGALLTNVTDNEEFLAELLFDRGYGYIGLHSEAGDAAYGTGSSRIAQALAAIKTADRAANDDPANGRRLGRGLSDTTPDSYQWQCDAAQFYCEPVCMRTTGFVTTKVSSSKCSGVAEPCSCHCLYDAHWDCRDGETVCVATHTTRLEPEIVGDLVCTTRGTPKPEACVRQLAARGTYPTTACMATFEEEKDQRLAAIAAREAKKAARLEAEAKAAAEAAAAAAAANTVAPKEPTAEPELKIDIESSALPAALVGFVGLFA